jgi:hypothetical protein
MNEITTHITELLRGTLTVLEGDSSADVGAIVNHLIKDLGQLITHIGIDYTGRLVVLNGEHLMLTRISFSDGLSCYRLNRIMCDDYQNRNEPVGFINQERAEQLLRIERG